MFGLLIAVYGLVAFVIIPRGLLYKSYGYTFTVILIMFLANVIGKVIVASFCLNWICL